MKELTQKMINNMTTKKGVKRKKPPAPQYNPLSEMTEGIDVN